jgi:hypothetical protein
VIRTRRHIRRDSPAPDDSDVTFSQKNKTIKNPFQAWYALAGSFCQPEAAKNTSAFRDVFVSLQRGIAAIFLDFDNFL